MARGLFPEDLVEILEVIFLSHIIQDGREGVTLILFYGFFPFTDERGRDKMIVSLQYAIYPS